MREFNILELIGDKITVRLYDKYLLHLKKKIKEFGGFYKVGKYSDLEYANIWQAIKLNKIPFYILSKLIKSFDIRGIEKQIEAYKAYYGRKWIENPVFHFKETPELCELIGHILGDGFISIRRYATAGTYTNTSKELIKEFVNLLRIIFGNVEPTISLDKRFDAEVVNIPFPIILIFSKIYPELLDNSVPKQIFNLSKEHKCAFIRALADDESCVRTSAIEYAAKERKLLEDLRQLHLDVGFSKQVLSEVKKRQTAHKFWIKGKGLALFKEKIGFKHPDKTYALGIELKRKNKVHISGARDLTKKLIISSLSKPKITKQISNEIGIQESQIRKHLKSLEKSGNVRIIGRGKYKTPILECISEYIQQDAERENIIVDSLNKSSLSTLEISKVLGLGKDRTMNYLYSLKKSGAIDYSVKGRTYFWRLNESRRA